MRFPLVGSIISRNSDPNTFAAKDQLFQNCYPEVVKNPLTGRTTYNLYKRFGSTVTAAAGGSYKSVCGAAIWNSFSSSGMGVFPFNDGTTLKLYDHTGAAVGSDISLGAASGAFINDTLISNVANLTVVAFKSGSGVQGWFVPEGGSSTLISDGDFPANAGYQIIGDFAHMDGFAFIMDTKGQIWNSDINSLANWTAGNFIPANSYADGGSGVARVGDVIAGLGRNSIEFYRNNGNPSGGSPLSRVTNSVKRFRVLAQDPSFGASGIQGARAYMNVGDSLYLIGGPSDSGALGIYRLDGVGAPAKVSSPYVDKLLTWNAGGACAGSFVMHGMTHAAFNVNTQTLCYCAETGFWWKFVVGNNSPHLISALGVDGIAYFGDAFTAGKGIYKANPLAPTFQDDGVAFTAKVRTENIDTNSVKRKFWNSLALVGDKQAVSGNTEILWTDDDFNTFNTERNYLALNGASGAYASTPDAAALDITGDIDIIARVQFVDWTPASVGTILSKATSAGNQVSYLLIVLTTGQLLLQTSPDGTSGAIVNGQSTVSPAFDDGGTYWVRMTLDVNDGAGNRVYKFYTAPDQTDVPTAWTQLGATVTTAGVTTIFNSTADLEVGASNVGTSQVFMGRVYRALLYNGIGGTLAASFNASNSMPREPSFVSSSGETWTINGGAFITSLSSVDMSNNLPRLTRLGSSRTRRSYHITDAVNRPWRVSAADVEYTEATG